MKFPIYRTPKADQAKELFPFTLRWTLAGLFILFSIVNFSWGHWATGILGSAQVHPLNLEYSLQQGRTIGSVIGAIELIMAGFLSLGWKYDAKRALVLAQTASLIAFVITLTVLSIRFPFNFELFDFNVSVPHAGSGFFIKDLVLMTLASSTLGIADL